MCVYIVIVGLFISSFEGATTLEESSMAYTERLCVVRGGLSSNDTFSIAVTPMTGGAGTYNECTKVTAL